MSSVASRPDVKGTVEQVMSGELFSGLLLNDADQRAMALEALLGKVVDDDTRVVWVGNPLRSPLTIERFLIQIVGPEVDLREERGPAELARLIAKPVGRETRLIIVVQQPETIDATTRELLVGIGGGLGGEAVHVQFLFVGSPAFAVPQLDPPSIIALGSGFQLAHNSSPQPATRPRGAWPLLLLLVMVTIGAVISIAPASKDGIPPAAIAAETPAPPPPSPLRREFDAFLAERTETLPPMTESQKDALFTQFLTHHHRE